MTDGIDWGWVERTLRGVQTEQRALRGMIEPVGPRLSALEARFSALEARLSGMEESLYGIGLGVRHQGEMLERLLAKDEP